jgi:hypothetical protein
MTQYVDQGDRSISSIHQLCIKKNISVDKNNINLEQLKDFGIEVLQLDSKPEGDVVTPQQTATKAGDGLWYRDYEVRNYTVEERCNQERTWRDSELRRIDIEILKAEDNAVDTSSLRTYRQVLRDYPQQGDFPNGTRPEQ